MPDDSSNPTERVQQTAIPGLGGVRLDLLDPEWIVLAAGRDTRPEEETPSTTEVDECAADLQQRLRLNSTRRHTTDPKGRGGRYDVARPPLDLLSRISLLAHKRYDDAGATGHEDTPAEQLAEMVWNVYRHTARGLTDNDVGIMAEWTARSLDVGYLATLRTCELPFRWVHLAGGMRSACRRVVLFCLMHAMANGWHGIRVSATEAARLWGFSRSTWWAAIAWLEQRGLLVRMNLWEPGEVRPTDKARNWYGPGVELLDRLDAILADFGPDDTDAGREALAEVDREHKRARAIRGRELRREAQPGEDAPAWAVDVADQAHDQAQQQEHQRVYTERAAEVLAGEATVGEEVPTVSIDEGLDVEQLAELERIAGDVAGLPPPAELADALADAGCPLGASPDAPPADVGPPAPVSPSTSTVGSRLCSSPIRLADGEPKALELPIKEPASPPATSTATLEQEAPRRPVARPETRAAPIATPPPIDPWGQRDWSTHTEHHDPLARWAAASSSENSSPPSGDGGEASPPQGAGKPCAGCRGIGLPWGCHVCGKRFESEPGPLYRVQPGDTMKPAKRSARRSLTSADPAVRESARAKLRAALDGKSPALRDALGELIVDVTRDQDPD